MSARAHGRAATQDGSCDPDDGYGCHGRPESRRSGAKRLGVTTTTFYAYVNGDGTPKAAGQALLDGPATSRKGAKLPAPSLSSQTGRA